MPVDLGLAGYDVAQAAALVDRLAESGPQLPGVKAAGLTLTLPLELHVARRRTRVDGYVPKPGEEMEFYFGVWAPATWTPCASPSCGGASSRPPTGSPLPGS